MQFNSKVAILKAIKQAQEYKVNEQEKYRAIINGAMRTSVSAKHFQEYEALGNDGFEALMSGESWPPTDQDWATMGVTWEKIPKRQQLKQVDDDDIAMTAHFYGEVADQTVRLKAMAKYYGFFEGTNPDIDKAFIVWYMLASLNAMLALNPSLSQLVTEQPLVL